MKLLIHLCVSQNTVEAAYGQLVAEGYLKSRPRKGYYVCAINKGNFNIDRDVRYVEEKTSKIMGVPMISPILVLIMNRFHLIFIGN